MQALKRAAAELTGAGPGAGPGEAGWVGVLLQELSMRWDRVCSLSVSKQTRLQQALKQVRRRGHVRWWEGTDPVFLSSLLMLMNHVLFTYPLSPTSFPFLHSSSSLLCPLHLRVYLLSSSQAEQFRNSVQQLLVWLSGVGQARFHGAVPEEVESVQEVLQGQEALVEALEERREEVITACALGQDILNSCHPDSAAIIRQRVSTLQTRYREVRRATDMLPRGETLYRHATTR